MTSLLRQHSSFFGLFGTGLFVGVGGTILYLKLTSRILREIAILTSTVAELRLEVQDLKEKLETRKKRRSPGFYSVHASSGDDDDEFFEDAFGGSSPPTSDFESVRSVPIDSDGQEIVTDETLFSRVDRLFDGSDNDKLKAYSLLEADKSQYLTDVEFYWRFSKSSYQVGQIQGSRGDAERKKQLTYQAKEMADKAVTLDDNCANAHKWFAITIGSIGDYEGTQDKIKNGYLFKEHIEKAIKIKPDDPSNHHLLGRWCFGVYMLSWIERKAASALYATPPTSTADEALDNFMEAERLNPGKWKENLLFIGKCYVEKSNYKDAVEWLEKASEVPVVSQDDKSAEIEIGNLLAKYKK